MQVITINPIRDESGAIVGEYCVIPSGPPDIHTLGVHKVENFVERGFLRFEGSPVTIDLVPDPLGPLKGSNGMSMTYAGDKLVFITRVGDNPSPKEFTYKITHYPIPQFFRHEDKRQKANDDSETVGVRIAPEYGLELMS